jgi:hypothetical protein
MEHILMLAGIFASGVIFGLVIGPDAERENSAHVNGWIAGHEFAKQQARAAIAKAVGEGE